MLVRVTQNAHRILKDVSKQYKYIQFGLKSGGCSGFKYYLEPCNKPAEKLDEIVDMKDYKIKIHNDHLFKLINTEIDYETNLIENKFIFNNPNSDFSCGCGKSFS